MFIFQSASSKNSNIDWASAFIGALPFCIFIGYSLHANYKVKKFSIPNSNGIILGTKTIELTSDGLFEVSSVSKCQYSWACVEEIAVNNGDYYIFLDKMYALIIPRSAFASSGSNGAIQRLYKRVCITNRCSRSQAPWDNNTWAQSLRSNFSPRVIAPKRGVGMTPFVNPERAYPWHSFSP